MRKFAWALACMLLVCGLVWVSALADGVTEDGFVYHITDNNEAWIIDYAGLGGHVIVPASIEGCAVVSVDFYPYKEEIEDWVSHPEITSIDVSACSLLRDLDCDDTSIKSLDVSQNPQLYYLSCSNTGITSLNLSNNPSLSDLSVVRTNLTELDISGATNLFFLQCQYTDLAELDVSHNEKLGSISIKNTNIRTLDVSNCEKLTFVSLDMDRMFTTIASDNPHDMRISVTVSLENSPEKYDLTNIPNFEIDKVKTWNLNDMSLDGSMLSLNWQTWGSFSECRIYFEYEDSPYEYQLYFSSRKSASPLSADTDHDGAITLTDILAYLDGSADVDANGDGVTNVADAVQVLKYLCGYGVTLE